MMTLDRLLRAEGEWRANQVAPLSWKDMKRYEPALVALERLARVGAPWYGGVKPILNALVGHERPRQGDSEVEAWFRSSEAWNIALDKLNGAAGEDGMEAR